MYCIGCNLCTKHLLVIDRSISRDRGKPMNLEKACDIIVLFDVFFLPFHHGADTQDETQQARVGGRKHEQNARGYRRHSAYETFIVPVPLTLFSFVGKNQAQKKVQKYRKRRVLIKKPKGQAGRSPPRGYNLRDEMGLLRAKRKYHTFAVRVFFDNDNFHLY
jgi:hypothetical protein